MTDTPLPLPGQPATPPGDRVVPGRRPIIALALLLAAVGQPTRAQLRLPDPAGGDRVTTLLDEIDGKLRAASSATLTLEQWCADHRMADPAKILVERDRDATHPATAAQRALLGVGPTAPLGYRKVRLKCGTHVLSEAENWFVPARLTPAMRATLDGSDEPFGKVVRPLVSGRRTLADTRLWRGDPQRQAMRCDETGFTHDALVLGAGGTPLALVSEQYKMELLCGMKGK